MVDGEGQEGSGFKLTPAVVRNFRCRMGATTHVTDPSRPACPRRRRSRPRLRLRRRGLQRSAASSFCSRSSRTPGPRRPCRCATTNTPNRRPTTPRLCTRRRTLCSRPCCPSRTEATARRSSISSPSGSETHTRTIRGIAGTGTQLNPVGQCSEKFPSGTVGLVIYFADGHSMFTV